MNFTGYSRQKNPVHQTQYFNLENCKNQVQIDRGTVQYSIVKDYSFRDFLSSLKFREEILRWQVIWQTWYPARILALNNHQFVLSSLSKIQQKPKDTIIIFESCSRKIFIKSWYIPMILIGPYLMNLPTVCNVYRI